jgi:hypothetical protein
MNTEVKTMKGWAILVVSAVIALHVAVASCIGAAYAFVAVALGDTSDGKLALVALAGVATFSGVPVMAKWVNDRAFWAFSKLFKC